MDRCAIVSFRLGFADGVPRLASNRAPVAIHGARFRVSGRIAMDQFVVDFDGELYLRQERGGMLMGTYERAGKPWSELQTPWDFGHQLLEPDLDRIAPSLEVGFQHFPAFQRAGIKQIINGPFTFAPDGSSTGGRIELAAGARRMQVGVDWLTGRVSVADAP